MAKTKHGTLVANVVTQITLTGHGGIVRVRNRSTTAIANSVIWVRMDGTDPVIAADDTYVVVDRRLFDVHNGLGDPVTTPAVIRLLSADPCAYSVEGGGFDVRIPE